MMVSFVNATFRWMASRMDVLVFSLEAVGVRSGGATFHSLPFFHANLIQIPRDESKGHGLRRAGVQYLFRFGWLFGRGVDETALRCFLALNEKNELLNLRGELWWVFPSSPRRVKRAFPASTRNNSPLSFAGCLFDLCGAFTSWGATGGGRGARKLEMDPISPFCLHSSPLLFFGKFHLFLTPKEGEIPS